MKTRLLLCFLCFFSLAPTIFSQSIYLFKYTLEQEDGNVPYEMLLIRSDDGTGAMRVKFFDKVTGQNTVVEMDLEESDYDDEITNDIDTTIFDIDGVNPHVIIGNPNAKVFPHSIVFEEDGNTSDYYPTKVAYTVGDDDMEAEFSENSFLEQKDLTEKLVGQFFRTDEDFYRNNTEEAITRNPKSLTPDEKKAKMYLVIVANTLDADIGASCIKDKDRTLKTFTDLAQFMKIQFEPRVIFDNDFDKAHVDGAIQAIQPNPNDIVIFYYSGHGFTRNDKYTYPYMALTSKSFDGIDNSNSLNIQEVYNQLNAKGARLTLVLSDCCNSDPNATNAEFGDVAATRTSGLKWNLDNCKALFLTQKRTSILMTAASRGELSAGTGNLGGIFTYNFRTSMVNYFVGGTKDDITWDNLLKDAQAQTIKKAENTKCKEENGSTRQCVQHPVYQLP